MVADNLQSDANVPKIDYWREIVSNISQVRRYSQFLGAA
jgi:hypothetical protein